MVTQLPVRIEFSLPDGWTPAPPDEVGASGAAFVALHRASVDGFTANITIAGQYRPDETTLDELADESVQRLQETSGAVHLRDRRQVGSPEAPGLTQVLDLTASVDNRPLQLVQVQVYVSMQDVHNPAERAVIELVLTCKPSQLDAVLEDFQKFVSTVRPEQGAGPSGNGTPA
ncbi:hypothetical protein [Amycolatopsis nigrescens]|uniref:hypothetical protein n=1 Tax=Amycolatopsis nigrescens TaxID=381445 RepID=UPI00036B41A6|nr:hypothetical protein [Amycolatopsis nigrescens]